MNDTKRWTMGMAFMLAFALARPCPAAGPAARDDSPANETKKVEDAIRVLAEMTKESDKSIPEKLLERSAGIAIIPDVIKAAYIIGGRHGNGVLLVRGKDGVWSNPSFIGLTGGSVGWQIGVESADIILVFKTPRSIENITRGKFTLGADAGVSAGPLGRSAEASTDAELKAEIYAYSRSRGLYAGLSMQGASLHVDAKANESFYGLKGIGPETIFEGKVLKVPDIALKLRKALENFSRPAK
jgi:lipid-binding SYLF domain-containing protein